MLRVHSLCQAFSWNGKGQFRSKEKRGIQVVSGIVARFKRAILHDERGCCIELHRCKEFNDMYLALHKQWHQQSCDWLISVFARTSSISTAFLHRADISTSWVWSCRQRTTLFSPSGTSLQNSCRSFLQLEKMANLNRQLCVAKTFRVSKICWHCGRRDPLFASRQAWAPTPTFNKHSTILSS